MESIEKGFNCFERWYLNRLKFPRKVSAWGIGLGLSIPLLSGSLHSWSGHMGVMGNFFLMWALYMIVLLAMVCTQYIASPIISKLQGQIAEMELKQKYP